MTVELELILAPSAAPKSITVDGKPFDGETASDTFFDSSTVQLALSLAIGAGLKVVVDF